MDYAKKGQLFLRTQSMGGERVRKQNEKTRQKWEGSNDNAEQKKKGKEIGPAFSSFNSLP